MRRSHHAIDDGVDDVCVMQSAGRESSLLAPHGTAPQHVCCVLTAVLAQRGRLLRCRATGPHRHGVQAQAQARQQLRVRAAPDPGGSCGDDAWLDPRTKANNDLLEWQWGASPRQFEGAFARARPSPRSDITLDDPAAHCTVNKAMLQQAHESASRLRILLTKNETPVRLAVTSVSSHRSVNKLGFQVFDSATNAVVCNRCRWRRAARCVHCFPEAGPAPQPGELAAHSGFTTWQPQAHFTDQCGLMSRSLAAPPASPHHSSRILLLLPPPPTGGTGGKDTE